MASISAPRIRAWASGECCFSVRSLEDICSADWPNVCPSQPSRQNDRVEIIANDMGNRTTPSYVAFNETERLIGDAAKNQVAMNATNTVRKKSEVLVTWPFFARGGARYAPESYDAANQLLTPAPEPSLTINT